MSVGQLEQRRNEPLLWYSVLGVRRQQRWHDLHERESAERVSMPRYVQGHPMRQLGHRLVPEQQSDQQRQRRCVREDAIEASDVDLVSLVCIQGCMLRV